MERTLNICGIDPGLTTGYFSFQARERFDILCLWCPEPGYHVELSNLTRRQLPPERVAAALELQIEMFPNTVVAVEKYTITARTARLTQQTDALEVTGVVKEVCRRYDVPCHVYQKSNVAKLFDNQRLKELIWYSPSQRHANDAARIAGYALTEYSMRMFQSLLTCGNIGHELPSSKGNPDSSR